MKAVRARDDLRKVRIAKERKMAAKKTNVVKVPSQIYVVFDGKGEIQYTTKEPEAIERGAVRVAVYTLDYMCKVTHNVEVKPTSTY
jgi:hypothetical protein